MGLTKQDGTQRALVTRGTTKERSLSGTLKKRGNKRGLENGLTCQEERGEDGRDEETPLEAIGATEINH